MTKPVRKESFDRWRSRLRERAAKNDFLWRIDPMLVFTTEAMLSAYYGSDWQFVWAIFRKTLYLFMRGFLDHLGVTGASAAAVQTAQTTTASTTACRAGIDGW